MHWRFALMIVVAGSLDVSHSLGQTSTNVVQAPTAPAGGLTFKTSSPPKTKLVYPWKIQIITTTFYIGEDASNSSAWDEKWTQSNRGIDDPGDRNGYASGTHASLVNPFYVALPFNDLAHPDKAREWVPASWQRPPKNGRPVSACQGRWVEIKTEDGSGHVCYAQWEDVGPNGNNHAEYVFGPERPDTGNRAGLDVSPAVAQYLGLGDEKEPIHTRWRFVDDDDVPPGAWLKYEEQAILYSALHPETTSPAPAANPKPDLAPGSTKP